MKKLFLLVALLGASCLPGFANKHGMFADPGVQHKVSFLFAVISVPAGMVIWQLLKILGGKLSTLYTNRKAKFSAKKLLVFATAVLFCSTTCFALTDGGSLHYYEDTPPIQSFAELVAVLFGISPVMILLALILWAIEYRDRIYWVKAVFTVCDATKQHNLQLLRIEHKKKRFRIFSEPVVPDDYIGPKLAERFFFKSNKDKIKLPALIIT